MLVAGLIIIKAKRCTKKDENDTLIVHTAIVIGKSIVYLLVKTF